MAHQQQQTSYVLVEDSNGKKQLMQTTSAGYRAIVKKDPGYSTVIQQNFTHPAPHYIQKVYTTPAQQTDMKASMEFSTTPYLGNVKIEHSTSIAGQSTTKQVTSRQSQLKSPRRSMPSTTITSQYSQQSTSTSSSPSVGSWKKTATKKTEKIGKGLRHFSMKVCQKVKEKGVTSYNEVADELVAEESEDTAPQVNGGSYDQKNIRRRVYDALNVLMAMNIISKEKKEIRWIGLPTSSAQECEEIEIENEETRKRIEEKQQQLRELILKHVSFKSLIERNKDHERRGIVPSNSSAVQLPFIVINTNKKTHINCNISNDKREYLLKFDDKFEVHDDVEVLKRMGLLLGMDRGESSHEDIEKLKKMVPKSYQKYIEMYGNGYGAENSHSLIEEEDWSMMDSTNQSGGSSTQNSTRYDSYHQSLIEEDQISDEGI